MAWPPSENATLPPSGVGLTCAVSAALAPTLGVEGVGATVIVVGEAVCVYGASVPLEESPAVVGCGAAAVGSLLEPLVAAEPETVRTVVAAVVEPPKLSSPEYAAPSWRSPAESAENEQVAAPVVESTGCAEHPPIVCPPISKATVPPSGRGETVAVSVTESPIEGEAGSGAPSTIVVADGPGEVEDGVGFAGAVPKPAG